MSAESDPVKNGADLPGKRSRFPVWAKSLAALLAVGILVVVAISVLATAREPAIATFGYRVVNEFPHDRQAYCQGLAFDEDGNLYEGTGQYGESALRQVDLETGKILREVRLGRRLFGEGITVFNDRIYQLTWKKHVAFVYDKATFKLIGRHKYSGEGWGLTNDGTHLIMSDGSSTLRFLDPKTFAVRKTMAVRADGRLVPDLNELEYIDGEIWANVWFKDHIARISPKTGNVTAWVDLSTLYPARFRPERDAVLNGIAYHAKSKRLFVTGKRWPKLFEIEVVRRK